MTPSFLVLIAIYRNNRRWWCLAAMLIAGLAPSAAPARAPGSLDAGSPAPAFKVGRWLKGGPIAELQPGRHYVIEFWGTQCAPCIAGFPHLSELAKKFEGRVTFIGVSLVKWGPRGAYPKSSDADQDRFMAEHGDKMDYPVVMDSPEGHMAIHWLNPAWEPGKLGGIPLAIIVDGDGRIAWKGRPDGLEPVLAKLAETPN